MFHPLGDFELRPGPSALEERQRRNERDAPNNDLVTGPAVAVTSRFRDRHQRDALLLASLLFPGVKARAALLKILFTKPVPEDSASAGPTAAWPAIWFDDMAGAEGTD